MKLTLTFKTPDVLDQIDDQMVKFDENDNRIEPDKGKLERIKEKMRKHIEYGEYVTLEYDTKLDTLRLL